MTTAPLILVHMDLVQTLAVDTVVLVILDIQGQIVVSLEDIKEMYYRNVFCYKERSN